jgi:polysaccharide export outer membrane protein
MLSIMRPALLSLVLLAVIGCSGHKPELAPDGKPTGASEITNPARTSPEDLEPFMKNRSRDYPLYSGDVIRISVQNHPDLQIERRIPADGKVPLFGIFQEGPDGRKGPVVVKAAGKPVQDLEIELAGHYATKIPSPYVIVRVIEYAPKVIYVSGAVLSPKDYRLPNDRRITLVQALTMAGWFTDVAAADRVRIFRRDQKTGGQIILPAIDVTRIVSKGEVGLDILLEPGDTVTVDSLIRENVFIFGHVKEPGDVPFRRGLTLTNLISLAGGLREYPDLSDVRVIRDAGKNGSKTYRVDLGKILDGRANDFPLAPGDRVYIDETFI